MRKIICIDFDGVIHSYTSGWQGVDVIPDPPVEKAFEWLEALYSNPEFEPVIYSSRSKDPKGVRAMQDWFVEHNFCYTDYIEFPTQKPAVWLTVDDRAFHFQGKFPSTKFLSTFIPWNKK